MGETQTVTSVLGCPQNIAAEAVKCTCLPLVPPSLHRKKLLIIQLLKKFYRMKILF